MFSVVFTVPIAENDSETLQGFLTDQNEEDDEVCQGEGEGRGRQ